MNTTYKMATFMALCVVLTACGDKKSPTKQENDGGVQQRDSGPTQHGENSTTRCEDGMDNDDDGFIDCDDQDCITFCVEEPKQENTQTFCNDGIDNDADGHIDCADQNCRSFCGSSGLENSPALCADGFDNDSDGARDCDDADCVGFEFCSCPPIGRAGAPCCFHESNNGKTTPTFRIAAFDISLGGLANELIRDKFNTTILEERFNWLIELDMVENRLRTGAGFKNTDGSFSFSMDAAPGEPPVNMRWNPTTFDAMVRDSVVSSGRAISTVTVPEFTEGADLSTIEALDIAFELPIEGLKIENMTMSNHNSCVGLWDGTGCMTGGALSGYLRLGYVQDAVISIRGAYLNVCGLLAGTPCKDSNGNMTDQSTWNTPPDARCENGMCTDDCVGFECNAWRFTADFAARGVNIR